jgi:hypothetical protein
MMPPSDAEHPRDSQPAGHEAAPYQPWWIGEGSEPCPFCLQGYVLELETRCVACDRPGCLHCMTRVRRADLVGVLCPECREKG